MADNADDRWTRLHFRPPPPSDAPEPDQPVLVQYVSGGRVALITLNRPHADNAISTELAASLIEILETIAARNAVRVAILAGAGSPSAARYVDVGGANDQSLYPPGNLRYTIPLKPGERRAILGLLRSPGSQAVPDPTAMVWTAAALRKAAEDVWRARWPGSVPAHPNP